GRGAVGGARGGTGGGAGGAAVTRMGTAASAVEVDAGHAPTGRRLRPVRAAWRCKWNVVRLAMALFVLWILAEDTGARLARLQLMGLREFDYIAGGRHLREAGRFGEAIVVADAGLEELTGEAQIQVLREKQATLDARNSFVRRLKDVGMGAVTGSAGPEGQ